MVACALAAVAVSACGGGGGSATVSIKTLRAAVTNTQAAQSSRFTMELAIAVQGKHVTVTGSGVATADGKQAQITIGAEGFSLEERIVGDAIYMDFGGVPALAGKFPAGKHWLRISFDAIKAQTGTDLSQLFDQAQNASPKQGLEYLQGLSGDVETIGDDTVVGQHATHYRASIDYSKVVDELPNLSDEVKEEIAELGTVPADVWINDHDQLVKMHLTIDANAFGVPSGGTAEMTMEITDFGVDVNVQPPPEDQVFDLGDLGSSGSNSTTTAT
jgi:hypothetical protein